MLTFRCQEFDDGTKFVESDMQVSCLDDRYPTVTSTFGTAGLLLFAVAPGALFLWVLWRNRAILKKAPERRTKEEALIVAPTAFLHSSYRPRCWWYEPFFIILRLMMCGGLNVWFPRESETGRLSGRHRVPGKAGPLKFSLSGDAQYSSR